MWVQLIGFYTVTVLFMFGWKTRVMGVLSFLMMNSFFLRNHLFWEGHGAGLSGVLLPAAGQERPRVQHRQLAADPESCASRVCCPSAMARRAAPVWLRAPSTRRACRRSTG